MSAVNRWIIELGKKDTPKLEIEGKVIFHWSKRDQPPYCVCCPPYDGKIPHRHNFSRFIKFPNTPSKYLAGGTLRKDLSDYESEFLHMVPGIEGKIVKVTFEVLEE